MQIKEPKFEISAVSPKQYPKNHLPEIVLAGKSNVGKSSFINSLTNRKQLARVSSRPGKTQTLNFYNINDMMYLVDVPGYGYAKVAFSEKERWSDLMEGYFSGDRNIPMVFQLIDMRHPATEFDISMLEFLKNSEVNYTVVLTKSDKLNKTDRENRLKLIYNEIGNLADNIDIIPFSSQTGEGVEKLRDIIEAFNR